MPNLAINLTWKLITKLNYNAEQFRKYSPLFGSKLNVRFKIIWLWYVLTLSYSLLRTI